MGSKVLMPQDELFFLVCLNCVTHNYNKINLVDLGGGIRAQHFAAAGKACRHVDVNIHHVCFVPAYV